MNQIEINGYIRINRKEARNIVNKGGEVYCCPNKLIPCQLNLLRINGNFENSENAIIYYNCNPETGTRLLYFKKAIRG